MPADYRRRVKAQFDVLEKDAWTQRDNFDAVVTAIKPVLDCADLEPATQPDDRQQCSDTFI